MTCTPPTRPAISETACSYACPHILVYKNVIRTRLFYLSCTGKLPAWEAGIKMELGQIAWCGLQWASAPMAHLRGRPWCYQL
jgi:hypothetical protein